MKISYVIPCYKSQGTIESVVEEVMATMKQLNREDYEIILVNDSSPDDTFQVIASLCEKYSFIKGINLAKNFGQHAALMAGFRHVSGEVVVCLDDDGQTPANEVNKLLERIDAGNDIVYASYSNKRHSSFRNLGSKVNELMTRYLLNKPKELYLSSYFAAKKFVIDEMIRYEHSYPYVLGLALRTTKNIENIEVTHREREEGVSGYTLRKLLGLWFNGFTAFSVKPLRIATCIGTLCALGGFSYGIYTIIKRLLLPDIPLGYSATMSAIVFFGGMIMIMLGLIGEYIGRIYISINNAPQYVIREKLNFTEESYENQRKTN